MAVYTTIDDPGLFFNPLIYTGTGVANASGGTTFTGVGFQGDLWWGKQRNGTYRHQSYDSVRGATYYLAPDTTEVQSLADIEGLYAWTSDGFTLGERAQSNYNTATFASWNWKAGTTTGIAGSPSITPSSYSFNQTSGFSIIAYTGTGSAATLPHGLGVVPEMIIVKSLTVTTDWAVYHHKVDATPEDYILVWNSNAAKADNNLAWNDTAPTSTLFSVQAGDTNATSKTHIAYCFAGIAGYSKFGSYTGNGNANGPFVFTGMRPAFVMIKSADYADSWIVYDDKRLGYNQENDYVRADTTDAEASDVPFDILSNGFKIRDTANETNGSGRVYTYMTFARNPLVNSNGVPGNAR